MNNYEDKSMVNEIFISQRADPYIVKGPDGYYYFTGSYPMLGENDPEGYDRVVLRKSKTIDGLRSAKEITIWDEKDSNTSFRYIWDRNPLYWRKLVCLVCRQW